jgi:radical SAM modification target selenobiotic family peptide
MEEKQLRKFLAGLCITGLLSGASLPGTGNAQQTQSG